MKVQPHRMEGPPWRYSTTMVKLIPTFNIFIWSSMPMSVNPGICLAKSTTSCVDKTVNCASCVKSSSLASFGLVGSKHFCKQTATRLLLLQVKPAQTLHKVKIQYTYRQNLTFLNAVLTTIVQVFWENKLIVGCKNNNKWAHFSTRSFSNPATPQYQPMNWLAHNSSQCTGYHTKK